jgi:TRAP transporter TAXI family solute receptor
VSDSSDRHYQTIAAGAGIVAILTALSLRRAPRWLRAILVALLIGLACGAGVLGYRRSMEPATLTVAAGSLDGDVPKLMTALAARLVATGAPVRLTVIEKTTASDAAEAFAKGETDLAVVRADSADLSNARAVMIVAHAVVLLLAPSGTGIQSVDDLKGKTVGVVGGGINQAVVAAISKQYDLERNKVRFRDMMPFEVGQAFQAKQVQALLLVVPISEKYISRIRDALLRNPKLKVSLVPIESAGAIAAIHRAYESFDVPKGTIRGSPAVPDEDLTTLRLPLYLVANKKLSDDAAGALAKAVFETRRDLAGDFPLLTQITEPSSEKDAFVPVHPGAAAYFSGDQKTFFDKHGDHLFYGSMLLGTLGSLLAGAWRFLTQKADTAPEPPLTRLFAVMSDVRAARSEADLASAETRIDEILAEHLDGTAPGEIDAGDATSLSLATHRLERLLERRRLELGGGRAPALPA